MSSTWLRSAAAGSVGAGVAGLALVAGVQTSDDGLQCLLALTGGWALAVPLGMLYRWYQTRFRPGRGGGPYRRRSPGPPSPQPPGSGISRQLQLTR